jgi:hypothetical protein
MSRYRKIEVRTWSDEKFRSLSVIPASGQGLWFFLLTGPHTTAIPGLFRAGRAAMAEELSWDQEAFDEAFREVSDQGMAKADFKAKLVWLPNAIRHNKPESPNVVRSWRVELDLLPECELKRDAVKGIREALEEVGPSYVEAFDEVLCGKPKVPAKKEEKASGKASGKAFDEASDKTSPNQEQEQEQEEDKEPNGSSSTASPSTVSRLPNCPHGQVIDLFAKHLPTLPQPKPELWDGQRAKDLRSRWKWLLTAKRRDGTPYATTEAEALDWFDRFFGFVADSDFLSGRNGQWTACDLGWLVKAANFAKVIQGNYQNKEAA